jgi:protein SCO1/2
MNRTLTIFLLLITLGVVNAQEEADLEIGIVEKLDQYIPMDAMLVNEHGDTVFIGDLIDKPTILNFVYYRCPGICSPLMDGLSDAMDGSDMVLGVDYQALTISFDARENTVLAVRKKKQLPEPDGEKRGGREGMALLYQRQCQYCPLNRCHRFQVQTHRK